jgi:protein TonB
VFLSFPDQCALVYLEQGAWGSFRMGDPEKLLAALRAALPDEPVFASDSLLRQRPTPRNHHRYVLTDQLPEAIEKVPPHYPAAALANGISGTVLVQALINVNGRVAETRVAWSVPDLDASAVDAVKRWRFAPARAEGRPVALWVMIPVQYRLH